MKRRQFVKNASLATAGGALITDVLQEKLKGEPLRFRRIHVLTGD